MRVHDRVHPHPVFHSILDQFGLYPICRRKTARFSENEKDLPKANTEEMVEKLLAISEQYGVRLHSSDATPENDAQFHQLAGIGNFILRQEGAFEFVKSRRDVLDPSVQELYGSAQYEEWQYTTATGALVNIASWDWSHPENEKSLTWVLYENDDTMITVFGTTPLGRENCEAFADSFDFAEAAK